MVPTHQPLSLCSSSSSSSSSLPLLLFPAMVNLSGILSSTCPYCGCPSPQDIHAASCRHTRACGCDVMATEKKKVLSVAFCYLALAAWTGRPTTTIFLKFFYFDMFRKKKSDSFVRIRDTYYTRTPRGDDDDDKHPSRLSPRSPPGPKKEHRRRREWLVTLPPVSAMSDCSEVEPCDPFTVCSRHVAEWERENGRSYADLVRDADLVPSHVARSDDECMRRQRMKSVIAGEGGD